jgi:hypothetical protein
MMPRRFRGMATIHRILGHIHGCQWIQEPTLEVVFKVPGQRSASTYAGEVVGWMAFHGLILHKIFAKRQALDLRAIYSLASCRITPISDSWVAGGIGPKSLV